MNSGGIADLSHAGAGIVRHLLHRCLGGQTAADRIGNARHPTAIGGEHAVGFDHIVVLAVAKLAARFDQFVDRFAHSHNSSAQTGQFRVGVLGHDLPDDHPRLVQHRRSYRQAGIEADPDDPRREHPATLALSHFEGVDEITACREFRDNHRDRLQDLYLVLAVMTQRAVLHDEDPENPVTAQDRSTHQRMVDLFAGFGAIGEIRMGLRICEGERSRRRCDHPDQPLADAQPCPMHRFGAQPLGGE